MLPGGILLASALLMVAATAAAVRRSPLPTRPYWSMRLWSANVALFGLAMFLAYGVDTGNAWDSWLVPAIGVLLLLNPLFTFLMAAQVIELPRWASVALVGTVATGIGVFFLAPPATWPGVLAMSVLIVAPYVIAVAPSTHATRIGYGVTAMRTRFSALGVAGLLGTVLSALLWFSGQAPVLGRVGIEMSMLVFAFGFVMVALPPKRAVEGWKAAAESRFQDLVDAATKDVFDPSRLPALLDGFIDAGVARLVNGPAPAGVERRTGNGVRGEIHRVDVGVPGTVLQVSYPLPLMYPLDAVDGLAGLARIVRVALRDQEARRIIEGELQHTKRLEKVKSDFLRSIGHELGNPLTPMALQIAVMKHGAPERFADNLDVLDRNLRRLKAVVGNLSDVGKLQDAAMLIDPRPVDVGALVHDVVLGMRPMAEAKGLQLILDSPDAAWVDGDQGRLMQVVGNLVSNAIKYADAGTVDVRIRVDDGVAIEVADQGRGLDAQQIEVLGQPYARFHADEDIEGTGLGMYITKGILDAHGGSLDVSSDGPGKGCTFRVLLPAGILPRPATNVARH